MKNILFTCICICCFWGQTFAQELPIFTQYREFQSFINPGALPIDYLSQNYQPNKTIGISYRNQWLGYKGGPETMAARYEHLADNLNSVFGGNILRDRTGRFSRTGISLRYAYKVKFAEATSLTIGTKFGFSQNNYDSSDGVLRDAGDITGETNVNQMMPSFGFGAFFNHEFSNYDIVYGGLSIPQLTNSFNASGSKKSEHLYEATHVYLNAGFIKKLNRESSLGSRTMYIEPSVWVKYTQAAPIHTDLNIRVHLPDLLWVGAGYGLGFEDKIRGNFLHFEGGVVLDEVFGLVDKNIKIGFGYDNIFSNSGYSGFGSSLEVNVSYSWL